MWSHFMSSVSRVVDGGYATVNTGGTDKSLVCNSIWFHWPN